MQNNFSILKLDFLKNSINEYIVLQEVYGLCIY